MQKGLSRHVYWGDQYQEISELYNVTDQKQNPSSGPGRQFTPLNLPYDPSQYYRCPFCFRDNKALLNLFSAVLSLSVSCLHCGILSHGSACLLKRRAVSSLLISVLLFGQGVSPSRTVSPSVQCSSQVVSLQRSWRWPVALLPIAHSPQRMYLRIRPSAKRWSMHCLSRVKMGVRPAQDKTLRRAHSPSMVSLGYT